MKFVCPLEPAPRPGMSELRVLVKTWSLHARNDASEVWAKPRPNLPALRAQIDPQVDFLAASEDFLRQLDAATPYKSRSGARVCFESESDKKAGLPTLEMLFPSLDPNAAHPSVSSTGQSSARGGASPRQFYDSGNVYNATSLGPRIAAGLCPGTSVKTAPPIWAANSAVSLQHAAASSAAANAALFENPLELVEPPAEPPDADSSIALSESSASVEITADQYTVADPQGDAACVRLLWRRLPAGSSVDFVLGRPFFEGARVLEYEPCSAPWGCIQIVTLADSQTTLLQSLALGTLLLVVGFFALVSYSLARQRGGLFKEDFFMGFGTPSNTSNSIERSSTGSPTLSSSGAASPVFVFRIESPDGEFDGYYTSGEATPNYHSPNHDQQLQQGQNHDSRVDAGRERSASGAGHSTQLISSDTGPPGVASSNRRGASAGVQKTAGSPQTRDIQVIQCRSKLYSPDSDGRTSSNGSLLLTEPGATSSHASPIFDNAAPLAWVSSPSRNGNGAANMSVPGSGPRGAAPIPLGDDGVNIPLGDDDRRARVSELQRSLLCTAGGAQSSSFGNRRTTAGSISASRGGRQTEHQLVQDDFESPKFHLRIKDKGAPPFVNRPLVPNATAPGRPSYYRDQSSPFVAGAGQRKSTAGSSSSPNITTTRTQEHDCKPVTPAQQDAFSSAGSYYLMEYGTAQQKQCGPMPSNASSSTASSSAAWQSESEKLPLHTVNSQPHIHDVNMTETATESESFREDGTRGWTTKVLAEPRQYHKHFGTRSQQDTRSFERAVSRSLSGLSSGISSLSQHIDSGTLEGSSSSFGTPRTFFPQQGFASSLDPRQGAGAGTIKRNGISEQLPDRREILSNSDDEHAAKERKGGGSVFRWLQENFQQAFRPPALSASEEDDKLRESFGLPPARSLSPNEAREQNQQMLGRALLRK
ncbi:unnamed protein product [Amoebophrya sp. A25]|nr:unnamed protein product [Amoebophrya sp. A25]|eukprot:GSA25T00015650001.1